MILSGSGEGHDSVNRFLHIVGYRKHQAFVFSSLQKIFHESVDGHFAGEEVNSEEDHRTWVSECRVVVLGGILEYLLNSACRSGGVYYSALCDGQKGIFPNAVIEVFSDVGCKGTGRFVTIEPCRNAKTAVLALRELLPDFEG